MKQRPAFTVFLSSELIILEEKITFCRVGQRLHNLGCSDERHRFFVNFFHLFYAEVWVKYVSLKAVSRTFTITETNSYKNSVLLADEIISTVRQSVQLIATKRGNIPSGARN